VTGLPAVPQIPAMPRARTPLQELRLHWGDAYLIGRDDERGWWAARRDRIGAYVTAADAEDLWRKIRADYAAETVSHDFDAVGSGR